jgi:predicted dinucleotide-binding enzyme
MRESSRRSTRSTSSTSRPRAGDDADANHVVSELIDQFGFDAVDAGPLAEGRRFQPGTSAYNVRMDAAELRAALTTG